MSKIKVFVMIMLLGVFAIVSAQTAAKKEKDAKKSTAKAKTEIITFNVDGMTCGACAGMVDGAANTVDGVAKCSVKFKEKQAVVEYDPKKTDAKKIEAALKTTGFSIARIEKTDAKKKISEKAAVAKKKK